MACCQVFPSSIWIFPSSQNRWTGIESYSEIPGGCFLIITNNLFVDYVVNMRITDPSCKDLVLGNLLRMTGTDDLVRKVDVVFFSRNTDALPKLHAAGDIVRLQGAQVSCNLVSNLL